MYSDLISVVIPIYKVEQYLSRCVESVLNQTYRRIEVILVDDGSPDRCGEICDAMAATDSRVRVCHKENGGVSDARNYGTERATGNYITYVDSDDYIAPDYLAYLYDLIQKHDADIACCCMEKTKGDHARYGVNTALPPEQVLTGFEASRGLLSNLYMVLMTVWGALYSAEIAKKYPFPVGRNHEDDATTCKYYFESEKVVIGNRCLYAYYYNPQSITHTKGDALNEDAIWALVHRAEFYEERNAADLAGMAWDRYYNYLAKDAVSHGHRCRHLLTALNDREDIHLLPSTRARLRLYCRAPWLFSCLYQWRRLRKSP